MIKLITYRGGTQVKLMNIGKQNRTKEHMITTQNRHLTIFIYVSVSSTNLILLLVIRKEHYLYLGNLINRTYHEVFI